MQVGQRRPNPPDTEHKVIGGEFRTAIAKEQ